MNESTAKALTPSQRELLELITCPGDLTDELLSLTFELLPVVGTLRPLLDRIATAYRADADHFETAMARLQELDVPHDQLVPLSDGMIETTPARASIDLLYDLFGTIEATIRAHDEGTAGRLKREAEKVPGARYTDDGGFIGFTPRVAAALLADAVDEEAAGGASHTADESDAP